VQLLLGEGTLFRVCFVGLDVCSGVPLVHDLDRVRAEALLAGRRPLVGRVGDEVAERTHGSEYERIVERFKSRSGRRSPSHSSTIAADHCHGNAFT
jgi:hypothetical protein